MKQQINISRLDRGIRLLLAAIAIYFYLAPPVIGWGGLGLMGIGVLLLLTGIKGFCPIYAVVKKQ